MLGVSVMDIQSANRRMAEVLKQTFPEISSQQALGMFGEITSELEVSFQQDQPELYGRVKEEFAMAYSVIDSSPSSTFCGVDILTTYQYLRDFLDRMAVQLKTL